MAQLGEREKPRSQPAEHGYPSSMVSSAEIVVCPHAERCSGCSAIGVPYGEQLARKRDVLAAALRAYPELRSATPEPTHGAATVAEYRVRAKLVASGTAVGLFARGTHDVIDIPECRVLSPAVARVVAAVRAELPFSFGLVGADAREVDGGVLLTLIVPEHAPQTAVREAAERLAVREPTIVGVALSRNPQGAPRLLSGLPEPLLGKARARHRLAPADPFQEATFGSFVQAHAGQAAALYATVSDVLESRLGALRGTPVLELYAGSGALALRLARAGARVTAVESFGPAAESIRRAAAAQALALDVVAEIAEVALERARDVRAVIVDPPRRGLSVSVRRAIARLEPELVVYVSCSPPTLARDLAHLARLGLAPARVVPFDMIPLSDAVEALAVLTREPAPLPTVLHEEPTFVAVDKPPFLPTTPQGEHTDSLLARVRRLPGFAGAAPVHRLDAGTSGVCLFARTPDAVNQVARALAAGTKTYLTLLRGIVRSKGTVRHPLRDGNKRRDATTRYRRDRVVGTHSLVQAQPEQGRQHQIRRHFSGLGHPVLGDDRYGDPSSNRYFAERHGLDRPFLHAARIELAFGETKLEIRAELAPDLGAVLASLESG